MDMSQYYSAQSAVLGCLLIEPDRLGGEIMHSVRPDDFQDAVFRNLYNVAREIWLSKGRLDAVTVVERAGQEYRQTVMEIMQATPTAANWEAYAQCLKDGARLNRIYALASKLFDVRSVDDGRKLLAQAEDILTARPGRISASYEQLVNDYLDFQTSDKKQDYLDWGIYALNENVRISGGRFVIIGADSSVGKTAFSLQLGYNIASKGKRVGFFSYETELKDAGDRIIANSANVDLSRSKLKNLQPDDFKHVVDEGMRASKVQLEVVQTAGYTVEDLRAEILNGRFDVVFIDYVQLIPGSSAKSRWEEVTRTSMELHTMSQQLGVTIIALSQITLPERDKNGNRRSINKGDLRESKQLINDADAIILLDLTDPGDQSSQRILKVAKNKDGPLCHFWLDFDPEHMRFTPSPQPKSETFRKISKAVSTAKKEAKHQQARMDGFVDLPPEACEPLPF